MLIGTCIFPDIIHKASKQGLRFLFVCVLAATPWLRMAMHE